ncbi:MAG: hypothetical protein ABEH47_01140 [Haloferacaceae archaeon]
MAPERVSRWARRHVAVGALALLAWQAAVLLGVGRRTAVVLGLYGFVLHTVLGKAYALVPTYFARKLAVPAAPAVDLPLTAVGVGCLALGTALDRPGLAAAGAVLWAAGVGVFLAALAGTLRGNLAGGETGTGEAEADRRPVDRAANAVVPAALGYLAVGAYATAALLTPLPSPLGGYAPRVSHLLAAGTAGLLVLGLGFRLLPRFAAARPPRALVYAVLPAGAAGPALLAAGVGRPGPWLAVGGAVEAVAVVGFALAVRTLFARSDRDRVGFHGVRAAAACGVAAVALGLATALGATVPGLADAHRRLNLLGFLGLTIVGMAYQFYPPAVGRPSWASDRTALASVALLATGLVAQAAGAVVAPPLVRAGALAALAGAALYALLLGAAFRRA